MAFALVMNRTRQAAAEQSPAFAHVAERSRRAGDLHRAVALCREELKRFPDHVSARVTLGLSLLDLQQYAEARSELQLALKRAPDNLAAIRGLAQLHDHPEYGANEEQPQNVWQPLADEPALTPARPDNGVSLAPQPLRRPDAFVGTVKSADETRVPLEFTWTPPTPPASGPVHTTREDSHVAAPPEPVVQEPAPTLIEARVIETPSAPAGSQAAQADPAEPVLEIGADLEAGETGPEFEIASFDQSRQSDGSEDDLLALDAGLLIDELENSVNDRGAGASGGA